MREGLRRLGRFILLVMLGTSAFLVQCDLVSGEAGLSRREREFHAWVRYYQKLMGVEWVRVKHYSRPLHPDYCAWVSAEGTLGAYGVVESSTVVVMGLSEPDPECVGVSPRTLARHEVCHIRMMHPWIGERMGREEKEREVRECMEAYRRREKGL